MTYELVSRKRPFTSGISLVDRLAILSFLTFILAWCSVYLSIDRVEDRKECIGWMPGHWEGRTLSEAKGHGEIPSVIHGSPIGKPYPSSVASLRSLDFSNLANWNIWVAKGREINRDPVSSGERERIGALKKNKDEASFLSKVFISFSPAFILFLFWLDDGKTSKLRLESLPETKVRFLFLDEDV